MNTNASGTRADRPSPLTRSFNTCLLRPVDLTASQPDVEVIGVFNPGVIETEDGVVLLVRVAEQARERRQGFTALPRWDIDHGKIFIDWTKDSDLIPVDVRVVQLKDNGRVRLNFTSHLRVMHSRDGRKIEKEGAWLKPENVYEEFGIEDPRITRIDGIYYFTYVAVSRHGVATALGSTRDFKSFKRHGIIFPPENKDVVLFPEKIGNQYCALHRPSGATRFTYPEMWVATSPDLLHWGNHQALLGGSEAWDIGRIGAGSPPIRTDAGWLEIYHGNSKNLATPEGGRQRADIGTYAGAALLLDLKTPSRITGRSGPLFVPETEFECEGFVPNVVFPTGVVERDGRLLIYYGAADTVTAVAEFSLRDILDSIRPIGGRNQS
jgi:beta-1,2-mannobiose phosphorylase / 1,2-beta-oligomannan phosphorylase